MALAEASAQALREPPSAAEIRRAAHLTALVGIIHALLFGLAYVLASTTPNASATDAELLAYYHSDAPRIIILVGLYIMPFAGIAFLWFIVSLRTWISHSSRREDILLSNIQLVSGVVFITLFFVAAAAIATPAASVQFAEGSLDVDVARQLPKYGSTVLFVFATRMAAMFVIATSNILRHAQIVPSWVSFGGFAVGLFLLLTASFHPVLILVLPFWVLVLSSVLLFRARSLPRL